MRRGGPECSPAHGRGQAQDQRLRTRSPNLIPLPETIVPVEESLSASSTRTRPTSVTISRNSFPVAGSLTVRSTRSTFRVVPASSPCDRPTFNITLLPLTSATRPWMSCELLETLWLNKASCLAWPWGGRGVRQMPRRAQGGRDHNSVTQLHRRPEHGAFRCLPRCNIRRAAWVLGKTPIIY